MHTQKEMTVPLGSVGLNAKHGAHVGALLFTLLVAFALAPLVGGLVTNTPRVQQASSADDEEQESAAPLDMRTPLPEELHSRWYTQTVAPAIAVGESADVMLQFRNVGHAPWIKGTPSEIRLGEVGLRPLPPEMKVDWPYPDRPARQSEDIVHEQQLATFSFEVIGTVPGTFRLRLQPVVDGVAWLKDEGVYVEITVK